MKKIIFTIIIFAIGENCFAQNAFYSQIANKAIYAELGGSGVFMSFNFDTRFTKSNHGWGGRIGVGFGINDFKEEYTDYSYGETYTDYNYRMHSYYTIPMQVSYVFGRPYSRSSFEIGGGVTALTRKVSLYNFNSNKYGYLLGHMSFMYRIAPPRGGFSFRVGLTPIIGTGGDLFPMAAVSFGYTF
ncbi:MAG: hypothetical protein FWD66_02490 [Paludibacter sp.]|nr:hypothetical protein [Paludibacter sp.]